jgi:hypothetical protein
MTTKNNIGKTIYISAALPGVNTAVGTTGFNSLTFTQIGGVQSLPQLGVTGANIDVPDLATGFTSGVKGAMSGNESTMTFRMLTSDAGQALVESTANSAEGKCSLKIVRGSGVSGAPVLGDPVQYAQGYLNGFLETQGDTTTHEGFTVTFKQNNFTVDTTQPT